MQVERFAGDFGRSERKRGVQTGQKPISASFRRFLVHLGVLPQSIGPSLSPARWCRKGFSQLLIGVIRQAAELDELLEPILDRGLEALDQVERAILRAGAFELKGRIDVPFKVVIDEYVALAKVFGAEESHRYVNAVLDKLARTERALETSAEG